MYSKANIKGHAIHPMLVAFPVAFYTATVAAFIIYAASDSIFWFEFATVSNWAGVGFALLAAVPGSVDWTMGIPKDTEAKTKGMRHMILNVSALALFFVSALVASASWGDVQPAAGWPIFLSVVGLALTVPSGILGWELVQKHHVGVDLSPEQQRLETQRERPRRERPGIPVAQEG